MKKRLPAFMLLLLSGFLSTTVKAQEALPSAGGNALGPGGSMGYSVAQTVFSYTAGNGGSVTEGVQQPYEIQIITGMEKAEDIILSLSVFPNPTTGYLTLKTEKSAVATLHLELYNLQGQLLKKQSVSGSESVLSMRHYAPAIYYLNVLDNQEVIKSFKIIKN